MTPIQKELLEKVLRLADEASAAGEHDLAWELNDEAAFQKSVWAKKEALKDAANQRLGARLQ